MSPERQAIGPFNPIRPGAGSGNAAEAGAGASALHVLPGGKYVPHMLGLGGTAGPGRGELESLPRRAYRRRRVRPAAAGAGGGRRAASQRAPWIVASVELRTLAKRYRELRIQRQAGQPDGPQYGPIPICYVFERDAQSHSSHLCRRVSLVARQPAQDPPPQRSQADNDP